MKTPKSNHSSNTPRQTTPTSGRDNTQNLPPRTKNIHISINLDAVNTAVVRLRRKLFTKRTMIIGGTVLVLVVGYLAVNQVGQQQAAKNDAATTANRIVENLEYQTVLPANKPINSLGGWRQISPPGSEPVYAYSDTVEGTAVTVSQQPLPQSFKGDVDKQVADMAKKFSATTTLSAGDTKIYVGASVKGPQSVIFTKNELLILIKSQQKIDDTAWVSYIASLS